MNTNPQQKTGSQNTAPGFAGVSVISAHGQSGGLSHHDSKRKVIVGTGVAILVIVVGIALGASLRFFPSVSTQLASLTSAVANIFSTNEQLTVSTQNNNVAVGEAFALSWNRENPQGEGSYVFSYPCENGVTLEKAPQATDSGLKLGETFACGEEITLSQANAEDSVWLIASAATKRTTNLSLSITYVPSATTSKSVSAVTTIAVENQSVLASTNGDVIVPSKPSTTTPAVPAEPKPVTPPKVTPPTKPTPPPVIAVAPPTTYTIPTETTAGTRTEQTYVVTTTPTVPNTPTDLSVRIIETGIIDKLTNTFVATTTPKATDRVAVRFEVINLGGKTSPMWRFNAVLPTFPSNIFTSADQQALASGDRIEFDIGFDSVSQSSDRTVVINVDPTNSVQESNKTNNIARVKLENVAF